MGSTGKKGTSGNRPGYKVFSFNTSVRNPKRNQEFLKAFVKFDGKLFDQAASYAYLAELVKLGIYKFTNVSESIKEKWENDIELTKQEIEKLIKENPQATGLHNRVMTSYMRSLKDQGFLIYRDDPKGSRYHVISISDIGKKLIDDKCNISSIYAKSMIALQANNPARLTMYNESRPFLNTLFTIDEVNRMWAQKGNDPKGILRHEFAAFVLSMKDCDYKKAANEIIKYREKFRYQVNKTYLDKYLQDNGLQPLAIKSLTRDYPDDVFRKFEMTGLLKWHGEYQYIYYTFSDYNIGKVRAILDRYKVYSHTKFSTQDEYYKSLESPVLPWEVDLNCQLSVIASKAKYLKVDYDPNAIKTKDKADQFEKILDTKFAQTAISKAVEKYQLKFVLKELMILSGIVKEDPAKELQDIGEPLRLEFLLALALAIVYGSDGLVSNIDYNENGEPMHCALGNQADIYFYNKTCNLLLEPTMRTDNSQAAYETMSIHNHLTEFQKKNSGDCKAVVVAPKIHPYTIDYLSFKSARTNKEMLACTICAMVEWFGNKVDYPVLIKNLHDLFAYFDANQGDPKKCADFVNKIRPNPSLY